LCGGLLAAAGVGSAMWAAAPAAGHFLGVNIKCLMAISNIYNFNFFANIPMNCMARNFNKIM